jgi:hypothetical protein
MGLIEKIQKQPESTKKTILWVIVAIIGISFSVWRIKDFQYKIETRENQSLLPDQYQELQQSFGEVKNVLDQSKQAGESIKQAGTNVAETLILVQEYIERTSENPEQDLKRIEEDEEFFNLILEKIKNE